MQVVEDVTTGNGIKGLVKKILKSGITTEFINSCLAQQKRTSCQSQSGRADQGEEEISK